MISSEAIYLGPVDFEVHQARLVDPAKQANHMRIEMSLAQVLAVQL